MARGSRAAGSSDRAPVLRLLGQNAARLRAQGGLTQREVARRARLSVSYVSMIESGTRSPTLEVLARLALGLGVSMSALFEEEAPTPAGHAPALEPLRRLLAGRKLAPGEVERLLTVVQALFPGRPGREQ